MTITGFKSFANKTVVELERGITGVVGPNGSGKSNLADAIRWALGEQGKNRLRLEDRDEVVFAGNPHRARASFAEVVLTFDNASGAFPLDLPVVEISRRMYRSGETDYRLAGRSVRLSDIQSLLAQAGVGAGSYAVIGQGMIDSILMSSPDERKLLFEEAAAVRAPELGREAAQRKLAATAANLTRLRDIAAELAPQLGTLEAAVVATDERARLEAKVAQLRAQVVAAGLAAARVQAKDAAAALEGLQESSRRLQHEQRQLQEALERHQRDLAAAAERRQRLQERLSKLESARDEAASIQAAAAAEAAAGQLQARLAELKDNLAEAQTARAAATARLADLTAELAVNAEAAARAKKAVDKATREVGRAQGELVAIRESIGDGARDQYLDHALQILKDLALGLGTSQYTDTEVKLLIHKAGRLLSHATRTGAAEILAELKAAQKQLEAAMAARDTAIEHHTNIVISGRSLEIDLSHHQTEVTNLAARGQSLTEEIEQTAAAISSAKPQSASRQAAQKLSDLSAQVEAARSELAGLSLDNTATTEASAVIVAQERAAAQADQISRDHAAAVANQEAAAASEAAVLQQAAAWGIDPDAKTAASALSPADLSAELARAEAQLEARTELAAEQQEQYAQVSQRHAELLEQIADLETAEADLTALIAQLDTLIRARFKENFQALSEHFSQYFARLFEGGAASLELSESETAGYGVVIKASPQGKRLTGIAALSGGERALAGVALVAAIMRVNPSPFVVLDEIDAALDEANSGRLAGILTELSSYSQLIVITHNRQTMQAAQVLFGVTLGENNVTSIISLRLEQAARLAAR